MNSLLRFSEAKTSRLREVANSCPNSDDFRSLLNEVTERILNRGDFVGLVVPMAVCVRGSCITWPRAVGVVRALNLCGQPVRVQNSWYEFLQSPDFRQRNWWGGSRLKYAAMEQGNAPTYDQIHGENEKVRLYTFAQNDIGKVTRIYGRDQYGQPLQEKDAGGNWIDGVSLIAAIPFVSTSMDVQSIDRVQREQTQKHQMLFSFNTVDSTLRDLADYMPGETDPWYARSKIAGKCCSNSCDGLTSIVAEVALQFVPVSGDDDLVLVSNLPALKHGFKAVRYMEAGNDDGYERQMRYAIGEMNAELNKMNPPRATPAAYEPFAGRTFHQQMI